jgi:hypothetical protein
MVMVMGATRVIVKEMGQGKGLRRDTSWRPCSFPHCSHWRGVLPAAAAASLALALCVWRNPRAVGGPKSTVAPIMERVRVRVRVSVMVKG